MGVEGQRGEKMVDDLTKDLYGKLWDNINNKDARVWTFLSFFGAAIALFLGSSISDEMRVVGFPFLVLLGFWATHLVLAAEWWSARNRLMVTQIERANPSLYKYIPYFYMEPRFSSEKINSASLLVLISITSLFMFISFFYLNNFNVCGGVANLRKITCRALGDSKQIIHICLAGAYVYLLFSCMMRRENTIDEYYKHVLHFETRSSENIPQGVMNPESDFPWKSLCSVSKNWQKDRKKYCWRPHFLLAFLFVGFGDQLALSINNILQRKWNAFAELWPLSVLAFLSLAIVLYIWGWRRYVGWTPTFNQPNMPGPKLTNVPVFLFFVAIVVDVMGSG